MNSYYPAPSFTLTKEESITGKRNKPAEDAIHDGIYITVSEPNPIFKTNRKYEYRTGSTANVWLYPYAVRTKRTIAIYRITFENMSLSPNELNYVSVLIGAEIEPTYYGDLIDTEAVAPSEESLLYYRYLEAIADKIIEAL